MAMLVGRCRVWRVAERQVSRSYFLVTTQLPAFSRGPGNLVKITADGTHLNIFSGGERGSGGVAATSTQWFD